MRENPYSCNSAADFARCVGVHRTTVVEWIKKGYVGAFKKSLPNQRYRIYQKEFEPRNIQRMSGRKPYPKHYTLWTPEEEHILLQLWKLPTKELEKVLQRNANSIRIKKTKMRKKGMSNA